MSSVRWINHLPGAPGGTANWFPRPTGRDPPATEDWGTSVPFWPFLPPPRFLAPPPSRVVWVEPDRRPALRLHLKRVWYFVISNLRQQILQATRNFYSPLLLNIMFLFSNFLLTQNNCFRSTLKEKTSNDHLKQKSPIISSFYLTAHEVG